MRTPAQPPAHPPQPTRVTLRNGQSYHLWSGRDGILIIHSGTVHLRESPYWLGDTMLGIRLELQAGQHYLIQRSGWAYLSASRDAEFLYYPGPVLGRLSLNSVLHFCRRLGAALPQLARRWLPLRSRAGR